MSVLAHCRKDPVCGGPVMFALCGLREQRHFLLLSLYSRCFDPKCFSDDDAFFFLEKTKQLKCLSTLHTSRLKIIYLRA